MPSFLGYKDDEQKMLMLAFKALVSLALLFIGVTSAAGLVRLIIGLGLDINTSKKINSFEIHQKRDPTKQYSNITPRAPSY